MTEKDRKRKPRVLLLCTNSDQAGAPLHVEMLVKALKQKVEFIILFGDDGPVARRLEAANFDTRILIGMRSDIKPFTDVKLIHQLDRLIFNIKPDLIHCHSSKAGLLGRIAGRRRKVPVLFTIHGWSWASVSGRRSYLALFIERLVAKLRGIHFIYVCNAVKLTGQSFLGLTEDQGTVIYNGIQDLGYIRRPDVETLRILMPARVSYPKDHKTLIRAFEKLPLDSELVLCGSGTDSSEFLALVKEWAPTRYKSINYLGQRNDIVELLRDANVMVLSSKSEAMPLSIIEAMSVGLPIIASNVGGIPELVVPKTNGFLVPVDDVNSFVEALLDLKDTQIRAEFGKKSRAIFEDKFHVSKMANQTFEKYWKIINT